MCVELQSRPNCCRCYCCIWLFAETHCSRRNQGWYLHVLIDRNCVNASTFVFLSACSLTFVLFCFPLFNCQGTCIFKWYGRIARYLTVGVVSHIASALSSLFLRVLPDPQKSLLPYWWKSRMHKSTRSSDQKDHKKPHRGWFALERSVPLRSHISVAIAGKTGAHIHQYMTVRLSCFSGLDNIPHSPNNVKRFWANFTMCLLF